MTEQAKQKLKYWLIGLFTGGAVAAPVTAFVCKNIYEKKIETATDQAETRGMNAMAEYAMQQQKEQAAQDNTEHIYKEEDYAEKDPRDYNVDMPGEEDGDPEQEEITYLGMTEKYNEGDVLPPRIISVDEFENNHMYEKSWVNWYSEDNVFEEGLKVIDDPNYTFGVTDGKELFKNPEHRRDPNICYIRNDKISTDFEVTRILGSYSVIVGGEPGLGEADT